MSTLSQFLGSEGGVPTGSISAFFPRTENALVEQNGDYYIKTGTSVSGIDDITINKILSKNKDFVVPQFSISLSTFSNIVFGNGVYVANSDIGTFRSVDTITWYPVKLSNGRIVGNTPEVNHPGGNIVFGNGVFVALSGADDGFGDSRKVFVFHSVDAITWTKSWFTIDSTIFAGGLTGGSGNQPEVSFDSALNRFYISLRAQVDDTLGTGAYYNYVYYSTDGKTWIKTAETTTIQNTAPGNPVMIVNGAGNLVLISTAATSGQTVPANYLTSTDGLTWTSRTNSAISLGLYSMKFLNGNFIGLGSSATVATTNRVYTSPTGVTWTARTTAAIEFYDVSFGAGLYVVVGATGNIQTSANLVTWTTQTSNASSERISAVEYDATLGLFIAIRNTGFLSSTDGINWTSRTCLIGGRSDVVSIGRRKILKKVGSVWYALLTNGIATSTDGTTWVPILNYGVGVGAACGVLQPNVDSSSGSGLISVNGDIWVCHPSTVGGLSRIAADNGIKLVNSVATVFAGVAYGAGLYVAAGSGGAISTSPDGLAWTPRTSGTANALTGVAWSGQEFIATGASNTLRSTDGITWASVTGATGAFICYSAGAFYISNNSSAIRRSVDGTSETWVTHSISHTRVKPINSGVVFSGSAGVGIYLYNTSVVCFGISGGVGVWLNPIEIGDELHSYSSIAPNFLIINQYTLTTTSISVNDYLTRGSGQNTSGSRMKIGNSFVSSTTFMYKISSIVFHSLSMSAITNANNLIDVGASCWISNTSGVLSWSPKTAVTSGATGYNTAAVADFGTGLTAASNPILYRKIT